MPSVTRTLPHFAYAEGLAPDLARRFWVAMKDEVNPAVNGELHLRAERAALAAFTTAAEESPERRAKLMEKAAAAVFRKAGTPRDAARLYAMSITAVILELEYRAERAKTRKGRGTRLFPF